MHLFSPIFLSKLGLNYQGLVFIISLHLCKMQILFPSLWGLVYLGRTRGCLPSPSRVRAQEEELMLQRSLRCFSFCSFIFWLCMFTDITKILTHPMRLFEVLINQTEDRLSENHTSHIPPVVEAGHSLKHYIAL